MATSPGGQWQWLDVAPAPAFDVATEDERVRRQLTFMLGSLAKARPFLATVRTRAAEIADTYLAGRGACDVPPLTPRRFLQDLAGAVDTRPAPVAPGRVFDAVADGLNAAVAEASEAARRQLSVRIAELVTAHAVQRAAQRAERSIHASNPDEARRVVRAVDAALAGLHFGSRDCLDATALARAGVAAGRSRQAIGSRRDPRPAA